MRRYRGGVLEQILKYVKRREVAEELRRRGIDKVSGESLNRWVRDGKELRPEVERELRALFGLPEIEKEAAPPDWVERLLTGVIALEDDAEISDAALDRAQAKAITALTLGGKRGRPRRGGGASGTGGVS